MSGLRIMVLTLLLLVLMTTSHQDAGEKQAMQRDAKNFSRRRLGIRKPKTRECEMLCEQEEKHCCRIRNENIQCAPRCLGIGV
uniref:G099 VD Superfamily O3 precursor conopeptide n=1 Tax=Conus geographus TaxID=6491 RepID=X5IA13_CONGE|nr:G099_VD_Superfamily_O3_precursor_conopeptide [Conus geographus]